MARGRAPRRGQRVRRDGAADRRDAHRRHRRDDGRDGHRDHQRRAASDPAKPSRARGRAVGEGDGAAGSAGRKPRRRLGGSRAQRACAHTRVLWFMKRLLIVEDKESLASMLRETVEAEGLEADIASTGSDAVRRLADGFRYLAIVTDLRLPGADGIAVLRQAKESDPDVPVIVMTAFGTIENAVEAMKLGAFDFIQKPVDVDYLMLLLRRCREHRELRHENLLLRDEFQKRYRLPAIIGDSPRIVEVSHSIQKVAPTDATVLLQ